MKLHYKEELQKYDLKMLFKDFASQSNRLLINYAKFREKILSELANRDDVIEHGALTDRGVRGCQRTAHTLSPFLGRRNNSTASANDVAGKNSITKNYTVADALHGYDSCSGTI